MNIKGTKELCQVAYRVRGTFSLDINIPNCIKMYGKYIKIIVTFLVKSMASEC